MARNRAATTKHLRALLLVDPAKRQPQSAIAGAALLSTAIRRCPGSSASQRILLLWRSCGIPRKTPAWTRQVERRMDWRETAQHAGLSPTVAAVLVPGARLELAYPEPTGERLGQPEPAASYEGVHVSFPGHVEEEAGRTPPSGWWPCMVISMPTAVPRSPGTGGRWSRRAGHRRSDFSALHRLVRARNAGAARLPITEPPSGPSRDGCARRWPLRGTRSRPAASRVAVRSRRRRSPQCGRSRSAHRSWPGLRGRTRHL